MWFFLQRGSGSGRGGPPLAVFHVKHSNLFPNELFLFCGGVTSPLLRLCRKTALNCHRPAPLPNYNRPQSGGTLTVGRVHNRFFPNRFFLIFKMIFADFSIDFLSIFLIWLLVVLRPHSLRIIIKKGLFSYTVQNSQHTWNKLRILPPI